MSWGDIAADRRGGGDSWIAGSYDPDLELFIIGTSQAKPWAAVSRGMSVDDDALYTNATLVEQFSPLAKVDFEMKNSFNIMA